MDYNNVFEKYSSEIVIVSTIFVIGSVGSYLIYQNQKNKKIKEVATVLSFPFFLDLETLAIKFVEGFIKGFSNKSN